MGIPHRAEPFEVAIFRFRSCFWDLSAGTPEALDGLIRPLGAIKAYFQGSVRGYV